MISALPGVGVHGVGVRLVDEEVRLRVNIAKDISTRRLSVCIHRQRNICAKDWFGVVHIHPVGILV